MSTIDLMASCFFGKLLDESTVFVNESNQVTLLSPEYQKL